jgi:predicted transcriptional regulator
MKTKIGTKSFAELREHKLARARKLDRKEHIPSEKRITFATADELLSLITPKRVRLCEVAREKPRSITELAAVLQRDRKAVHRDVQALHSVGMLLLRKEPNPGHGQVQVVTAAASRFQLVAEV